MLTINYNDKSYEIKNSTDEFLIKEFETISSLINDTEKNHIEKWSEIFTYLGLPQDVVDDFDSFAFIEIIKNFNISDSAKNQEIQKEIELDGIMYKAYDETFKLTVKEMMLIEAAVKKNSDRYLGELMAIIYKRDDLDKAITYDKAHIHFKAELIRKQIKAEVVIPLLGFLGKKLIKDYNLIEQNDK